MSNATVNQSAGYYAAFNLSTVDSNLAAANIVSGKTIFGVAGSAVARTCTGTLFAGGRWCDYGTVGTVMDMTTGLVWLKNANCTATLAGINNTGAGLAWSDAVVWSSAVKSGECGLSDSSVEGDWRLPTQSELKALTTGTENVLSGSPGPFSSVQVHGYWSATTWSLGTGSACLVYLDDGVEGIHDKSNTNYVWPVR